MENFNPRDMNFWAPKFPVKVPVPADGKVETCREQIVCEFCFDSVQGSAPDSWEFIWQSYVCPLCQARVKLDGGYNIVKGGAYAEGKPDPRAKHIHLQYMAVACHELCVDDSGDVPLRTVFPKHDLGQWEDFGVAHCFVFATIERPGRSEVRALHLYSDRGQDALAIHSIGNLG